MWCRYASAQSMKIGGSAITVLATRLPNNIFCSTARNRNWRQQTKRVEDGEVPAAPMHRETVPDQQARPRRETAPYPQRRRPLMPPGESETPNGGVVHRTWQPGSVRLTRGVTETRNRLRPRRLAFVVHIGGSTTSIRLMLLTISREDRLALHTRQPGPWTGVDAGAECKMPGRITVGAKDIRVVVLTAGHDWLHQTPSSTQRACGDDGLADADSRRALYGRCFGRGT